jgi:hypothetical protein
MPDRGESTCTLSENFVFLTHEDRIDYPVLLNTLLQGHPTGNLAPYFKYVMTKEGPGESITHIATAKCEHHVTE